MKIPRELIRELIASEEFKTTGDIMGTIKSMFADVLNEVLEGEIEEKLGHEKHERRSDGKAANYRNGSTKRKLKTQLGEIEISVPRDRNGEYESQIIEKYQRSADGLSGFREAIGAAFPFADIQRCIIHQIRSSTKYV